VAEGSVVVLVATCQGLPWLRDQMASILAQRSVTVRVLVSDDGSTDGTRQYIESLAAEDGRVSLLPPRERQGGSAQNFLYIMATAEIRPDEWVAFADQDDIWELDKLSGQLVLAQERRVEAVSSSITAIYPDGRRRLIRKDYPQRRLDFIAQSAGPGSTYLLSPEAYALVSEQVRRHRSDWTALGFHDSLIYALVRGAGRPWYIDSRPTVQYRQHEGNVMGANVGVQAARERARMLQSGWYRKEFILLTRAALAVSSGLLHEDLSALLRTLEGSGLRNRLRLAGWCPVLRRRRRDQVIMMIGALLGRW
jgi:rhamnosyltransferase